MKKQTISRREFFHRSFYGTLGVFPLYALLFSSRLFANANQNDYKAIVCILLEGGADTFNMLIPYENDAYDKYRVLRSNLAVEKNRLLSLNQTLAVRDTMHEIRRLYNDGTLAIVSNVGTLVEPVTVSDVYNGSKPVPFELFAHNTQRMQWLFGDATGNSQTGWGARALDRYYGSDNAGAPYGAINVADINAPLFFGGDHESLHFDDAYVSPDTMTRYGFGPESGGDALGQVYQSLYQAKTSHANKLMRVFAKQRMRELTLPDRLEGLFDTVRTFNGFDTGIHEVGKPLGAQLELVAQILSVKDRFPGTPSRQIFFVTHHGWDTHDSDNAHHAEYLSNSLGAFQNALNSMGISEQVTTITVSDFGRSLSTNGAGTDHGWGTYTFVCGGAVNGGNIYGTIPRIEINSPDAWYDRLVPTISMESYLATVLKWFGLSDTMLDEVLPNLHRFSVRDIGFMS